MCARSRMHPQVLLWPFNTTPQTQAESSMAAADTSKDLSLSLSGVDASADRAKERAEARGDEIAVSWQRRGIFGDGDVPMPRAALQCHQASRI